MEAFSDVSAQSGEDHRLSDCHAWHRQDLASVSNGHGDWCGAARVPRLRRLSRRSRRATAADRLNMLVAIGLVHGAELFSLNQSGGLALELQGMFLLTAAALVLTGPGPYRVNDN
jgi:putative oxidoreductase